jgi:serine/threonine-protein kinase
MVEAKTIDLRHTIRRCPDCGQQYSPDSVFCPFDGAKLELDSFDPGADPLIGQTIDDRYEVVQTLGEGGMGTVYEVRHKSLKRSFAMKVLRRDLAQDEELAARFTQEAKATAAIRHPHVVSISDFGNVHDGRPYFVMELLDGTTLSDLIKTCGPIPALRGARIVSKVARGLAAAHAAGVVHRDLKPENVVLLPGDGDDDVRIVDFGAAMLQGQTRLTKAGIVFGTPHYMSPEQASGEKVDHRADIYSLGVIMYEMFTGRVPFEGDTYMGVLTQHMYVQPTPPSKVVDASRQLGALETVILRALEKRPADRFQSMEELEQAVLRLIHTRDGVAEIAPAEQARASRPVAMADELEPPALEQIRASIASHEPKRSKIGWIVLSVVALVSVAIGALAVPKLFGGSPPAESTATSAKVEVPTITITPPAPAPSAAPSAASIASTAAASTTSAKPIRRAPAPKATTTSEFRDPWK